MDDLLREFLTETSENLDILDVELVKFENAPDDGTILATIFRRMHTIKGTCGFIGLPRLEALAHAAEDLLGHYRDGAPATAAGIGLLLETVDRIRETLTPQGASADAEAADADLIARLRAMISATPAGEDINASPVGPHLEATLKALERAFRETPGPDAIDLSPASARAVAAEAIAERRRAQFSDTGAQETPAASHMNGNPAPRLPSTIRVQVGTLEHLMEMVSELALTRNQLLATARTLPDERLHAPLQRLSVITRELQSGIMKARMQPIGYVWRKLPRLVRDLSKELGKPIELETSGGDIELDRQVLEMIKDPLIHMVRNSADHGLEDAATRRRLGKPEKGKITLTARRDGSHVIVEILDDGRGLDTARIRARASELGLAVETELDRMPDNEVHKLVFRPGLTTAASLSTVSGRGVGLDVVRSNIELIGGSVDLSSIPGQGTIFAIKIPRTPAIMAPLMAGPEGLARRVAAGEDDSPRALLVDDSDFFHALLAPVILAAGYRVALAASLDEALARCVEEGPFDAVIADIDLPRNGASKLARAIRTDASASQTLLIGLASRLSDGALEESRRAGFQHLVGKFDRPALSASLESGGPGWAAAA